MRFRWIALLALTALPGSTVLRAADACYTDSCSAAACGASNGNFTTLVAPGDIPDATAATPIAFVDPADGLRHRFVETQEGVIWVWDGGSGTVLATPFLDLRSKVEYNFSERGLLALAVDPDYRTNGLFYVYYTRSSAVPADVGDIVIERYSRQSDNVADPASAETILVIEHTANGNHNGGWLAFGPDRMLYVSVGDGGGSCDSSGPNGQNINSVKGKLLRLDVRGEDLSATAPECDGGSGNYGIPLGNPFAGATPGCGEIWALGLRNPFRFSFDRGTGDIWIGDVGQSKWEEINYLPSGYYPLAAQGVMNFGWRCREGCQTGTCSTSDCPSNIATGTVCKYPRDLDKDAPVYNVWDPILCHENQGKWESIMGGYRYRGSALPALDGRYLYGDAFCGQLWITTAFDSSDPVATTASCWDSGQGGLYGFAEDHQGELYMVNGYSGVKCIHDGSGCPWADDALVFDDGFESSDTSAWSSTVSSI